MNTKNNERKLLNVLTFTKLRNKNAIVTQYLSFVFFSKNAIAFMRLTFLFRFLSIKRTRVFFGLYFVSISSYIGVSRWQNNNNNKIVKTIFC